MNGEEEVAWINIMLLYCCKFIKKIKMFIFKEIV